MTKLHRQFFFGLLPLLFISKVSASSLTDAMISKMEAQHKEEVESGAFQSAKAAFSTAESSKSGQDINKEDEKNKLILRAARDPLKTLSLVSLQREKSLVKPTK